MRPTLTALAAAVVLALTGCSSATTGQAPKAPADAAAVTTALAAQGLPLKLAKTYTENDDPNQLLGRPGGYTSKTAFTDSRLAPGAAVADDPIERGGSVEVFPDAASAMARGRSVATLVQAMSGLGAAEYDYVSGTVLLRVSGALPPTQAKDYSAALAKVTGETVTVAAPLATP